MLILERLERNSLTLIGISRTIIGIETLINEDKLIMGTKPTVRYVVSEAHCDDRILRPHSWLGEDGWHDGFCHY